MEIKLNKSNNNPFYGLRNCLSLQQKATGSITISLLDACWEEVKDSLEKKQMFFSVLFSIGDITARHHNIFGNTKRDSGGNANREAFHIIFEWMLRKTPKQFMKFLWEGIFDEYQCFDTLYANRVQTKGSKVLKVYNVYSQLNYKSLLLEYTFKIIKGNNPFKKHLVAKFLTPPRLSKRSKHKKMLDETKKIMEDKASFLVQLSELMGWEYEVNGTYANFKGYRQWRKQYNQELESVLFSTGKIFDFSKDEFLKWFDKLPAQARYRTKNKILYSKNADDTFKYQQLQVWYKEWEAYKESKQAEQRVLEEKVRQGQASLQDVEKLEKVKKEAKVNVGATNFKQLYEDIKSGRVDELKLEAFMNKVNLPYNSLVILDDSGSMRGEPFNFGCFLAAVCLCKNPDDDGRNLLGFFNTKSHWHGYIDVAAKVTPNRIMRSSVAQVAKSPFVDPKLSFYQNYKNIEAFCKGVFQNGCTNISAIPEGLKRVCDINPAILDAVKSYPVWTIISDGEWNNLRSPEASINDFFRKCESWFGFKPFIVAIDVDGGYYSPSIGSNAERFSGIDNFIYIPANPAQIEQFLTNFNDMDIFDVYTPLQSIFRSNRYDLIRQFTVE